MKIDDAHNAKGNASRVTRDSAAAPGNRRADRRTPTVESGDDVHLSPRARAFAEARRQLAALPDMDAEKVREIQRRLQSGHYRLEADKIAESMIRDALNHQE